MCIMQYSIELYFRQEQLSTQTTGETSHKPSIGDKIDVSELTELTEPTEIRATKNVTATNSTTTTWTDASQVSPLISTSTTESSVHANISAIVFRHDNASGTYEVFTDGGLTSNSSSDEWRPTNAIDEYYYASDQTETRDNDGLSTRNNDTENVDGDDVKDTQEEETEHESNLLRELLETGESVFNITESKAMSNSSLTAATNDTTLTAERSESAETWVTSTTSTASPMSTAWLLAELPSDSDEWTNEVHSSDKEYAAGARRQAPSAMNAVLSPATFSTRLGPHWRLFRRLARPARRRTGAYRQILASPFVAGGGAMTERERKRALLHAYLLSGIAAGKDPTHRRAMSAAAVFYRTKLAKPPPPTTTQHELGGPPKRTDDAELTSSWNSPSADVTASPHVDVTVSWTDAPDRGSVTWNHPNSSAVSRNYGSSVNWTSVDNVTRDNTSSSDDEGRVSSAQLRQTSSSRAAAAAVVIPIIVALLDSLTRKQFSWLDMTLAVCGTVAVVLGLINLVVFVVHLVRTKRGKLSFHAGGERQRCTEGHPPSSSLMPVSRLPAADAAPPPPPPPPPLPLTGFGGLSRTSRDVSRDALPDDETLRIRPLTFKRPLTDWGFTNSATSETAAAVVVGQAGGVTVKSTGSDASSSGIESNGGRSDESTRRACENVVVAGAGANNVPLPVASSVITNYAYCGNGGVNRGIIIDVDDYRDHTCTSPSDFVFGKNYGQYYYYYYYYYY